jgi:hypothetical protein
MARRDAGSATISEHEAVFEAGIQLRSITGLCESAPATRAHALPPQLLPLLAIS